jgi:hypothetical protein
MLVVGGCYRESCESPRWSALFGSGGRAAAAISRLSASVELHTYFPADRRGDLYPIEAFGIQVHATPSKNEVAFAYFHPLSIPALAPKRSQIVQEPPLVVEGEVVLRFGFLEGDAIVQASRAVYDPQTALRRLSFRENGSKAKLLAIVLNDAELQTHKGTTTLEDAAWQLMKREEAAVIVLKRALRGAQVYEASGQTTWIPAYESPQVFKIGSGDVFTAAFSFYWGEMRLGAAAAADLASRSTALYCGTREIPLMEARDLADFRPVGSLRLGSVVVLGSPTTLGARWLLEETRSCLSQLGIEVIAPGLEGNFTGFKMPRDSGSILVLGDALDPEARDFLSNISELDRPLIIFKEGDAAPPNLGGREVRTTFDFATAIYMAGWAAAK